jgi:hypothetical protein
MTRQKKDANAPKRPLSAYIIYCQEQREMLKKKNPDLKATELTSQLGNMWKSLSDDKKKQYMTKHEKERERYQREMKDYSPPQREEEEDKKSRRKSKKDVSSSRPKRAPSAYIIFCQDKRAEVKEKNPSFGPKEITSKLGELWRELDVETKAQYSRRSKEMTPRKNEEVHEEEEEQEEEEVKPQRKEKPKRQRRGRRQEEAEEDLEDDE